MLLSTFINILAACIGFMASIFFAIGAMSMTPVKIFNIAASYWDANLPWGDSIADQRADYITGGLLLVMSFSLQLAANLVPPTSEPSLLQPYGCAIAEIAAAFALLLVCSVLLRCAIAKKTRIKVRQLVSEMLSEQELKKHAP
jgi:hypothetical protein